MLQNIFIDRQAIGSRVKLKQVSVIYSQSGLCPLHEIGYLQKFIAIEYLQSDCLAQQRALCLPCECPPSAVVAGGRSVSPLHCIRRISLYSLSNLRPSRAKRY